MTDSATPLVELRGISKSYSGATALRRVHLQIERGAVHALIGENGAGKSTLVKILTGVVQPDEGQILVNGQPQVIHGTQTAFRLGISAMYQDPTVFLDLSVAENIFAGHRPKGMFGAVAWQQMRQQAQRLLDDMNLDFKADMPTRGLSVADRQTLEIVKALSAHAELLIMDEPTASLSPYEVENLFNIVRELRKRNVAILFISHRLDEVTAIADTITVLRDGEHICTRPAAQMDHKAMIQAMVGRSLDQLFPKAVVPIGDVVLKVTNFTRHGVFSNVNLEVRQGEIVGLAGFVGAGRSEVAWSLFGIEPFDEGSITVDGQSFRPRSVQDAMAHGISYLPEDRLSQGLVSTMSIANNISMSVLPRLTPAGFLRPGREQQLAQRFLRELSIKASSVQQWVKSLSGGNQQKVVLSKWLAVEPKVLILDEPTRGVDVGTKADVYRTMSQLAGQGMGILLISSELPEILGMSDRVIVMREGVTVAEFARAQATQERIIAAASGIQVDGALEVEREIG
jgi:rhamnose transport system ATP-binding protein